MEFIFLTLLLLFVFALFVYLYITKKKKVKLESQVRNKIGEEVLIAFGLANGTPNIDFDTKLPSAVAIEVIGHLAENTDLELITYDGQPAVLVNSAVFLIKVSMEDTLIFKRINENIDG